MFEEFSHYGEDEIDVVLSYPEQSFGRTERARLIALITEHRQSNDDGFKDFVEEKIINLLGGEALANGDEYADEGYRFLCALQKVDEQAACDGDILQYLPQAVGLCIIKKKTAKEDYLNHMRYYRRMEQTLSDAEKIDQWWENVFSFYNVEGGKLVPKEPLKETFGEYKWHNDLAKESLDKLGFTGIPESQLYKGVIEINGFVSSGADDDIFISRIADENAGRSLSPHMEFSQTDIDALMQKLYAGKEKELSDLVFISMQHIHDDY